MIPMVNKLLKHFVKKNYKNQIHEHLGLKKSLKKEISYMSSGKDMIFI